MQENLRYKFLLTGMKSKSGHHFWKINEWYHVDSIEICEKGFHCSKLIVDAQQYVPGEILALVEVKGEKVEQYDKECWSDMRVIKAYKWEQKDSVEEAIFCAELVLHIYEEKYPEDKRPINAIEAAKTWLKDTSEESRLTAVTMSLHASHAAYDAAHTAAAAAAAAAAADAAAAAANAANAASAFTASTASTAASAAASAAAYAAYAAAYAAYTASSAASTATLAAPVYDEIKNKIHTWLEEKIKTLEEIK